MRPRAIAPGGTQRCHEIYGLSPNCSVPVDPQMGLSSSHAHGRSSLESLMSDFPSAPPRRKAEQPNWSSFEVPRDRSPVEARTDVGTARTSEERSRSRETKCDETTSMLGGVKSEREVLHWWIWRDAFSRHPSERRP
jgi:hypothetical protein